MPVRSEERLSRVLDGAHEAFVAMDEDGAITDWNRAAEVLFGWRRDEVVGRALGEIIVPPAHRAAHAAGLARFVATGEQRVIGRRLEFEAVRRDGSQVPVELTISCLRTDGAWAFHGFLHDLSAQRAADAQAALLATAHERFERAFEDAPIGMALVDLEGRFTQVNRSLREFLAADAAALLGRHVGRTSHPDDLERHLRVLRGVRDGRERAIQYEGRFLTSGGELRWGAIGVSVVRAPDGAPLHYVAQVLDITARKSEEEQLASYTGQVKERTRQDPVTGLPARPQFDADVNGRLAAGEQCALVLLRAPDLAELQDRRGRVAADRTLRMVAAEVTGASRASDTAYRVGPATLALCLHGTPRGDAAQAGERIRRRAEAHDPELTLDLLVLQLPDDATGLRRALRRDDAAGPRAASAGRGPADGEAPARTQGGLLPHTAEQVGSMLEAAREHLGMDVAWLSEFTDGQQVFRALEGDAPSFGLAEGEGLPLEGSFCVRVLDGRLPDAIPDTAANPVTRDLDVTTSAGIGSYAAAPVQLADGHVYGMLCAAGHDARAAVDERDVAALRLLAGLIAERIDHERRQATRRRLDVEDAGVSALLAALDARDHYTGDHSEAVVGLSASVARRLGMPPEVVQEVEQVALLHDIGKVGIPDSVLHKPGPLNELEWELMRQHSALGGRIVASIASLAHLAPAVRAEHERWDGRGYPDGLAGTAIPVASRIILAADAYHAMTSDRPYRAAMDPEAALAELRACAGTQFDSRVVEALVSVVVQEPQALPLA